MARPQGRVVAEGGSGLSTPLLVDVLKSRYAGDLGVPESGHGDFALLRLPANKANPVHCLAIRLLQPAGSSCASELCARSPVHPKMKTMNALAPALLHWPPTGHHADAHPHQVSK